MINNPFDFAKAGLVMGLLFMVLLGMATYAGEKQGLSVSNEDLIDVDSMVDAVDGISESVKTITVESQNWFVATIASVVELPSIIKGLLEIFMFVPELFRTLLVFVGLPDEIAGVVISILILGLVSAILFMLYKYQPIRT